VYDCHPKLLPWPRIFQKVDGRLLRGLLHGTQVALQCVHLGEHDVKQNVVNESRPGVAACAAQPTHG